MLHWLLASFRTMVLSCALISTPLGALLVAASLVACGTESTGVDDSRLKTPRTAKTASGDAIGDDSGWCNDSRGRLRRGCSMSQDGTDS